MQKNPNSKQQRGRHGEKKRDAVIGGFRNGIGTGGPSAQLHHDGSATTRALQEQRSSLLVHSSCCDPARSSRQLSILSSVTLSSILLLDQNVPRLACLLSKSCTSPNSPAFNLQLDHGSSENWFRTWYGINLHITCIQLIVGRALFDSSRIRKETLRPRFATTTVPIRHGAHGDSATSGGD
jgi:hypothetical protein